MNPNTIMIRALMCLMMDKIELNGQLERLNNRWPEIRFLCQVLRTRQFSFESDGEKGNYSHPLRNQHCSITLDVLNENILTSDALKPHKSFGCLRHFTVPSKIVSERLSRAIFDFNISADKHSWSLKLHSSRHRCVLKSYRLLSLIKHSLTFYMPHIMPWRLLFLSFLF